MAAALAAAHTVVAVPTAVAVDSIPRAVPMAVAAPTVVGVENEEVAVRAAVAEATTPQVVATFLAAGRSTALRAGGLTVAAAAIAAARPRPVTEAAHRMEY